jgi:hypothetical protein
MKPRYWNRPVGWWSLVAGIATGLVMGLWSFDGPLPTPAWIGEYADTSRRLIRLGHIAFVGLGILDILIADELTRSSLDARRRLLTSRLMVAGNIGLPIALIAAAWWWPIKYLMGVPAVCVCLAMVLAARGASHD